MQVQPAELTWEAREVVREVNRRPHLVVRLTIRGTTFPHRALVPFVRIGDGDGPAIRAWFSEVDEEGALHGYFATDLPAQGIVEYGYANQLLGRVRAPFSETAVNRLDRRRLDNEIIEANRAYLARQPG